jgi:hypothetical protein
MSSHSDPGENFPWDWYIERVRRYRWRYFQHTALNAAGKVIARSDAVREGGGRLKRAKSALRKKAGSALAKIRRRRVF